MSYCDRIQALCIFLHETTCLPVIIVALRYQLLALLGSGDERIFASVDLDGAWPCNAMLQGHTLSTLPYSVVQPATLTVLVPGLVVAIAVVGPPLSEPIRMLCVPGAGVG